ncbi:hypothetical protein VNO80_29501 [Phaseolus coccineus]|uniref:Uncharacterized protein n=1 Tax=Phaseolus coccineus TaxID=3886 RepID=A0AAN9LBK3_PHACN
MSMLFVFSLFLLLDVPKSCNAEKNYTSFMLVQQWPEGYCEYQEIVGAKRRCKSRPHKFTIHGLWPQESNGQLITNCTVTSNLTEKDIKPVEPQLHSNWPNLIGTDLNFWQFEWTKHGSCSENEFPKLQYFQLGLHNYAQNNLMEILEKAHIVPNKTHLYNATDVLSAVHKHTQHDAQLACYVDPNHNASALYQIGLCYADDGKTYKNCPNSRGTCRKQLMYPK